MKRLLGAFILVCSLPAFGQVATDTIKLNFLYGSIPAKGHKEKEPKYFGGLKGGHVNIEANGRVLDFTPKGNCPVLPNDKNPKGGFSINSSVYWDTASSKWATVKIPVTKEQLLYLDTLFSQYSQKSPYDYAVFGMRCAAASYDVLSEVGIFKPLSQKNNIISHFYPKLLRKRVLKWAKDNNYPVEYHTGRNSRKWESDEGIF